MGRGADDPHWPGWEPGDAGWLCLPVDQRKLFLEDRGSGPHFCGRSSTVSLARGILKSENLLLTGQKGAPGELVKWSNQS